MTPTKPVARLAAVATQRGCPAKVAAVASTGAVRQADLEASFLAQQRGVRDFKTCREGEDVETSDAEQLFVGGKCFYE